jgi:TPR repeat protein
VGLGKTDEENIQELMKRVEANDAGAMFAMGSDYHHGRRQGIRQDQAKAMELWKQAAKLGNSQACYNLALIYKRGGDLKKAKFHYETAAMAGNETARYNLGTMEAQSGDRERAVKHWMIAASAGDYTAMHALQTFYEQGAVSRNAIDSTLTVYNNSCAEMRSEARDAYIRWYIGRTSER